MNQKFTVYRKSGEFDRGEFIQTETAIHLDGAVIPTDPQEVQMFPEGDRISGMMTFYSDKEIMPTRNLEDNSGTSDEILWGGHRYRVAQVYPWNQYYGYKAVAVRMQGS